MREKYEISLWEDFPATLSGGVPFLDERKLCVIGSDTMTSQARALEPKMVNNVNGTNTFSFKMYYSYIDGITGENVINPFSDLLINERKVKVYWKDKWYDMLIKNMEEDTTARTVTYTCQDLFITELSRNGYNLEFTSDLQNNIGTASELAEQILDGSGWQFDTTGSVNIIQRTEEPVYEVNTSASFNATKQSPSGDTIVTIPNNKKILVFYSSVVGVNATEWKTIDIQFLYSVDGYSTDENDMLVLNGDCYTVQCAARHVSGHVQFQIGSTLIVDITTSEISTRYRANRLVKSQITKYDKLFDRYVNVYTDNTTSKEVWGYSKTEFSDPLMVVNLFANSSGFKDTNGWIGNDITWGVYPKFTNQSDITTYTAKSYLKLPIGKIYNSGLNANQSFLKPTDGEIKQGETGGFHVGDKYIFRVKVKTNGNDPSTTSYINNKDVVTPIISKFNDSYTQVGNNYFSIGPRVVNGNWNEYLCTCITAKAASEITELGLFLQTTEQVWIEDVEFFKYATGIPSYNTSAQEQRINPGEVSLQGISKTIYRYYNSDHDGAESADKVTFLYEGEEEQLSRFIPQTNNYEKMTSIEAKNSNRFNILQQIAENFECWVRFNINHDETGKILFDNNGLPQKYVTLVEQVGTDLGWSFEYGIDLRAVKRKIISDTITTKIIVIPNENEFADNGFCTIARSDLNYSRDNFILNFDYFINQGLLDQEMINKDLYSSYGNYIGYYYFLHKYNKEYDEITDILTVKKNEYTKQIAQEQVISKQHKATEEKITSCESDIMRLADVTTWAAAQQYVQTHTNNTKVQSLMNTHAQLVVQRDEQLVQLREYDGYESGGIHIKGSLEKLSDYIEDQTARQQEIIAFTNDLHERFYKKYARFIQEGTWQSNDYIDADKYYLDAVDVAYTSSRPQLQYDINVMRLSGLEDFTSKTFDVGDICYVQDRDYFGYTSDGVTPYKLKIVISEVTSYFDSPEKDTIKVQNYKTQFDDLFQRISATAQSLQYASGGYEKAASVINHDKTLSFNLLQETFDYNSDLVLNASNQHVTWDETGITVTDDTDAALQVRIMAGGLFVSNDGGVTWKNAIRGDGISTDILTAGRINTSEIFVYDGGHPSFRWDSNGINAYTTNVIDGTSYPFSKYVRFDQFGLYGYQGTSDFVPSTEDAIWDSQSGVKFGLTWKGFFLRGENGGSSLEISDDGDGIVFKMKNAIGNNSLEISTSEDIVLKTGSVKRVQIGRLTPTDPNTEYGIWVRDGSGDNIFNVSSSGVNSVGGWTLTKNSFYHTVNNVGTIGFYSSGQSATIQGETKNFYILAGNKFGVTVDGNIYSSGGKIGGWTIGTDTLTGGNITIDSDGTINCYVNNDRKWELDNSGDLFAKTGEIAGWLFTSSGLYNKSNGTWINSGSPGGSLYTIDTDSLFASSGNVGGWSMSPSGFVGSGIGLYNDGSITVGSMTITDNKIEFANGNSITSGSSQGIWVDENLTANGWIGAGGEIVSSEGFKVLSSTVMEDYHFNYLNWLYNNWGQVTPNQVRAEGANGVYASNISLSKEYISGSSYNFTISYNLKNDTTGRNDHYSYGPITLTMSEVTNSVWVDYDWDGDDYIWVYAKIGSTELDSSHIYVGSGYGPGSYGDVDISYQWDIERREYRYEAYCYNCGASAVPIWN